MGQGGVGAGISGVAVARWCVLCSGGLGWLRNWHVLQVRMKGLMSS